MMQAEERYHVLHHRPFQAIRIHLRDGRTYDIRHPEQNVVGVNFFAIGIPIPGDPNLVAERVDRIPLALIERLEWLKAASSPGPGN